MAYQQEDYESKIKKLVSSRHTILVSKKENNAITLSRAWEFVQGIQEDYPVNHEDIGIHGFYFGKKRKKTGLISSLKLLIHLWPDNW